MANVVVPPLQTVSRDWDAMIDQEIATLKEENFPKIALTRSNLNAAMQRLEQLLGVGTKEQNWKRFLRWEELKKELDEKEPDVDTLEQLQLNMRQNYRGLEMQAFTQVRDALVAHILALRYCSNTKDSLEVLTEELKKFKVKAQNPLDGSDIQRQRDFGFMLRLLDGSKQASRLANALRTEYGRPNVRVLVSDQFLSSKMVRPVDEANPVSECILGTSIVGNSFIHGQVTPRLVPNTKNASLRMEMAADFCSDNQGFNRGVTILTKGSAALRAAETISLFDSGLQSLGDTFVDSNMQTNITGILHKRKIVRRIASRQADKKKPQADAIGEGKLRSKLGSQYHEKLVQQLQESNSRLNSTDLSTLLRLGLSKPTRSSWSSNQFLALLWKASDPKQLMASASCPLPVQTTGMTLQLHQSVIANVLDPVIGNRILKNKDIPDLMKQFSAEIPEGLAKQAEEEPWSVSLASFHPVEVEFDNNLVRFRIRTIDLVKGDQTLDQPASIEAAYQVELQNNEIQLVRQGDVDIKFSGQARGLTHHGLARLLEGSL